MPPEPELPDLPPALPVTEALVTDQAAAQLTDAAGENDPVHTHCENCGTRLAGPYCHQCGQHDFDIHRSFRHLLVEALDALFNIEGRFFRSLITLLFRPGRLTAEFIAGQRVIQMPPFRLYIFVSFLFFLVIFLDTPDDQFVRTGGVPHQGLTVNGQPVTLSGNTANAAPAGNPAPAAPEKPRLVDQVRATADAARSQVEQKSGPKAKSALSSDIDRQLRKMNDPEFRHRLSERIQASIPHMLMLCLPLFALYTRVLFRKSGLMYLQHLVLALHFHTFIYLWVVCRKGWVGLVDLPGWGLGVAVAFACNAWLWIYPVVMLRRLFANSWPWTLCKAFALAFVYSLTLGVGFMLMAVLSVLLT
jgi:hypothetical protein